MSEAVVRSLLRLLVTVGILFAVYLLLVKPILDTTENTINQAFEGGSVITDQIEDSLEDAGVSGVELDLDSANKAEKLLRCIQRAEGNVDRIQRCQRRFSR